MVYKCIDEPAGRRRNKKIFPSRVERIWIFVDEITKPFSIRFIR